MLFNCCPLSIPDKDTWDVIELIFAQEETGIPITGTCLFDQTEKTFEFRNIIMSEKNECMREISDAMSKEADKKGKHPQAESKAIGRARTK